MTEGMKIYAAVRGLHDTYQHVEDLDVVDPARILAIINSLDNSACNILARDFNVVSKNLHWHEISVDRGVSSVNALCVFELVNNPDFHTSVDVLSVMGMISGDHRIYTLRQSLEFLNRGMLAVKLAPCPFEASDALIDWLSLRSKRNPKKLAGRSKEDVIRWLTQATSNKLLCSVAKEIGEFASRSSFYRPLFEQDLEIEQQVNAVDGYKDRAKKSSDMEVFLSGRLSEEQLKAMARNTVARQYVNDMWAIVRGDSNVNAA